MRATLLLALCLSMVASVVAPPAHASDWVDEDQPAQPRQISPDSPQPFSSPGEPPIAPSRGSRTAFFVNPSAAGGKHPLEGNVSRFQGGANAGGNGYYQGATSLFNQPFLLQKPGTASVAPEVFRNWLEKTHPSFALSTSGMSEGSLVQVKGAWDDADRTLNSLGLHHMSIRGGRLPDMNLDQVKVLIVNCPGKVPNEAAQQIRNFVARGGYLLTTDWSLNNLLERAFPGYVQWNGAKATQTMVDATVVDSDPNLLKGTVPQAYWKVDDGSQLLQVLRPNAVRVLVRSHLTAEEDPLRMGILAVMFPFGRGQVMHLVGHFDNNAGLAFVNKLPDPAPGIGISLRQALAANFIIEGLSTNQPGSPLPPGP